MGILPLSLNLEIFHGSHSLYTVLTFCNIIFVKFYPERYRSHKFIQETCLQLVEIRTFLIHWQNIAVFLEIMQVICPPALLQPNSRPFIVTQQTTNIKGIVQ